MATDFVVLLPPDCGHQLDSALDALGLVPEIEARLSVYRIDSDVSRLNRAGGEPCEVHADVIEVLKRAAAVSQQTEGAFDITAGPLVDAWGFTTRSGRKPQADEIAAALAEVGWRQVAIDADRRRVRLGSPSARINFGAIGKGFAIDRVTADLLQRDVTDFLIHGGNSTIAARGSADPESDPDGGWLVGLQHPQLPKQRLGEIRLCDAAMSTSGPGKQFFHHRGKRYGHVIDPRTGMPAGDLESLTVVTAQATESDALATGLFVAGREAASAYAEAQGVALYGVAAKRRQGEVEVVLAGGAELRQIDRDG